MIETHLSFAHQLADLAGAAIRPYFQAHGDVETKGDASPVTQADRAAEAAMRALITLHYPFHSIYGEEYGSSPVTQHPTPATPHYTWVIDPIDGTRNFIAGGTAWGTLIALCEGDVPILGILDQPITGERWVGVAGQPSTINGITIRTRPCASLAEAVISTSSTPYFTPDQAARFDAIAEQSAEVLLGGDCYAYGDLARGEHDMVMDAGLKPYDILALVPIIEGAGGHIRTWDGNAVTLSDYANVIAVGDA